MGREPRREINTVLGWGGIGYGSGRILERGLGAGKNRKMKPGPGPCRGFLLSEQR